MLKYRARKVKNRNVVISNELLHIGLMFVWTTSLLKTILLFSSRTYLLMHRIVSAQHFLIKLKVLSSQTTLLSLALRFTNTAATS